MEQGAGSVAGQSLRLPLIITLLVCGILIAALSLAPWVHFDSPIREDTGVAFDLMGTETSRLRDIEVVGTTTIPNEDGWCSCRVDIGDGYGTTVLGVVIALGAAAAWVTSRDDIVSVSGVLLALGALAISGFNAIADWQAFIWTRTGFTEFATGDTTVWLWLLVAASVIAALASAALWAVDRAAQGADYDYYGQDETLDGDNEAWA